MFVYILKNKHSQIYIGQTQDLENRLSLHNLGKVKSTKDKKPWEIIHFEEFTTRSEAMRREKALKSGKGRKWIKTMLI